MKAYKKKYVYISSHIKEDSETYQIIKKCLCNDLNCQYCEIIGEDELLILIQGTENKREEIRFGCVTPQTEHGMIAMLLNNIIPVLFFGPDNDRNYKFIEGLKLGIDLNLLKEMIYNIDELDQISGAIKWVHLYYYHLKEKMDEIEEINVANYLNKRAEQEQSIYKKKKAMQQEIAYAVVGKNK